MEGTGISLHSCGVRRLIQSSEAFQLRCLAHLIVPIRRLVLDNNARRLVRTLGSIHELFPLFIRHDPPHRRP